MREQLIQYVELLFAGAPEAYEIKQEILQNTLDRYDDLIDQGKSPEAAYRLAISGIGDINEILNGDIHHAATSAPKETIQSVMYEEAEDIRNRKMRAVAVGMYILSPVPLFILNEFGLDVMGLCFTILLVAAATALIMMTRSSKEPQEPSPARENTEPKNDLRDSIEKVRGAITLAVYLLVSFVTKAWFITWLIFPISGCIQGLINAILDLKEAKANET